MLSLSSGDSSPPPSTIGAKRSGKRRKMIISEDEDEEEDVKPIGNIVRVSGDGASRRNHFKGFEADGVSYELEDTVLISPEEHNIYMKPVVAIIKDISAMRDGRIMVTGRRFYRPEFANLGEERELFYTLEEVEFPAELVMHKCRVHFVPSNKKIPSCEQHPGFIVQKVYDAKLKRLYAILDDDRGYENDTWQHELFLLVVSHI
ncbi:hypothetical protein L2E82_50242 [Cichorium intybus]|nr:hypothetical protein L2E82_50242 [Cichorium intybus]